MPSLWKAERVCNVHHYLMLQDIYCAIPIELRQNHCLNRKIRQIYQELDFNVLNKLHIILNHTSFSNFKKTTIFEYPLLVLIQQQSKRFHLKTTKVTHTQTIIRKYIFNDRDQNHVMYALHLNYSHMSMSFNLNPTLVVLNQEVLKETREKTKLAYMVSANNNHKQRCPFGVSQTKSEMAYVNVF